jgi:hypothetical protein
MQRDTAQLITWGVWQTPWKVIRALCSDGKRRTAWIKSEPDTYFSIPACVKVQGKTVSGFVTGCETEDYQQDYEFIAYTYGKNGGLLP